MTITLDGGDEGDTNTTNDNKLQAQFYSTSVVKINNIGKSSPATNPLIARGAFGQVDIALLVRRQHPCIQHRSPSKIHSISLAAVKTIPNATIIHGRSSQQNSAASLTREAFAELNALRLLNGHDNVTPLLGFFSAQDSSSDCSGFGGWDWANYTIDQQRLSSSLCLVFPYHPIDLHEALIHRRFYASSKFASDGEISSGDSYYLPKLVVQSVMNDVLSALCHLHSHFIVHRDLKPGNLYITRKGMIQLGDFGLAKIVPPLDFPKEAECTKADSSKLESNVNLTDGLCTLQYRPPEMLLGGSGVINQSNSKEKNGVNGAIDIFSAGCIFAELLKLSGPVFPGQSVLDQLGRIFHVLGTPSENNWPRVKLLPDWNKVVFEPKEGIGLHEQIGRKNLTDELDLLSKMLVLDPSRRSSARNCLEHRWYQSFKNNCGSNSRKIHAHESVVSSLLPSRTQFIDPVCSPPRIEHVRMMQERDSVVYATKYACNRAAYRQNFVSELTMKSKVGKMKRWAF
ncbi:hypothetical protein ACHAW6_014486 [Cyclotella cf. meneghiniana]